MKTMPGLNIQFPISREILSGRKTIETRIYPLPKHYLNVSMAIIETPGTTRQFSARVVGTIEFSECFRYRSKKVFYSDIGKHLVGPESPYAWKDRPKWGWIIKKINVFKSPLPAPKRRGIKFTKSVQIKND